MSLIKEYNPFKKFLLYFTIGLLLIAFALVLIFINWVMSHIYTVIWFIAVIGCVIWFIYSLFPIDKFPSKDDLEETFN